MVRVVALANNLKSPAFRYRVGQFIEPLRAAGVDVTPRALPRDRAGRYEALAATAAFDVAWLERRTLSAAEARRLRRHAHHILLDLDDAIWMHDRRNRFRPAVKRRLRFRRTARLADLIVAGNDVLAARARRYNPAVEVVPTCVQVERYHPREDHVGAGTFEMVWIGQASTLRYLEGIMGALEGLAQRRPARLRVIADVFPSSRRLEVVPVRWSLQTEASDLGAAHVGLAPLTDDPWARGKCGLKVLQYMAAGLPVVASPAGVQAAMIGRNERGRLALAADDWLEHLAALADDPGERRRLGSAGRAFVEEHYSAARWVPRLADLLRSLARRGGRAR